MSVASAGSGRPDDRAPAHRADVGTIDVQRPRAGTTFSFMLRFGNERPRAPVVDDSPHRSNSGRTILIGEHIPTRIARSWNIAMVLVQRARRAGIRVTAAMEITVRHVEAHRSAAAFDMP